MTGYRGGDYKDMHSPAELAELLVLGADGKSLFWLPRDSSTKENRRWTTRYANKEALCTENHSGYLTGMVKSKSYYAHRVVWCLHFKAWPSGFIDHINGDKKNNHPDNLREVVKRDNNKNSSLRSDSKTGVTGVSKRKGAKKRPYIVGIKSYTGKQIHGGAFETLQEASARRKELEQEHGYHANHGKKLNEVLS